MDGRVISEAPNARWAGSLLNDIQVARHTRNLVYKVAGDSVDGHYKNIHRLIVPLSADRTTIDEYVVGTEAVPAQ
jgi:hypothetical protein